MSYKKPPSTHFDRAIHIPLPEEGCGAFCGQIHVVGRMNPFESKHLFTCARMLGEELSRLGHPYASMLDGFIVFDTQRSDNGANVVDKKVIQEIQEFFDCSVKRAIVHHTRKTRRGVQ